MLIYIGGRKALNGKSWAVALVVVVWVLILVFVPVITGAIAAPVVANTDLPQPITLPSDSGSSIVPEATMSESDLFGTLVPGNDDNSQQVTPLALPAGSGVISTAESNSEATASAGDLALPTTQAADNGMLTGVEPDQPTATPS